MIITIDIGNTHIYGGVFIDDSLQYRFRYPATSPCTSDTFGLFLQAFLAQHHVSVQDLQGVVLSSVVPSLEYSIIAACKKYLHKNPLQLKPGIKTGLKLNIKNPLELGADRVANAIAALQHFPDKNIIIVDFGTATTICALDKNKTYLGGAIMPGMKTSLETLSDKAAKLAPVELALPATALGKTTTDQLQCGLIYGQFGAIKEIIARIHQLAFTQSPPVLLATGGYAHLLETEQYFAAIIPDLVLQGLKFIWEINA